MSFENMISALLFGILRFAASVILAVGAIYFGVKAFDRLTEGIGELEELKKGNAAVGILFAGIIISIAAVVQIGVTSFANGIQPGYSPSLLAVLAIVNLTKLIFGLILAIITIFVALNLLDKLTEDIDEIKELKRGNVGIALLIAGILIAVSLIARVGIESVLNAPALDGCVIAEQLGIEEECVSALK